MKSFGKVAAAEEARLKRLKHRQWIWCRRPNGFCDLPKWRVVAGRLKLPLPYVVAFVNRLEELANDAGNKGLARGEVVHFSAEEFGLALGMTEDEAARIFAALEEPSIGWVAYDHIADFYDRNKDSDLDDTAALRQRRKRARADVLAALVKLVRKDLIDAKTRFHIEADLKELDDEDLFGLRAELVSALYTGSCVTRELRRDSVTVTPEQSKDFSSSENSGAAAAAAPQAVQGDNGESGENPMPPELWLATEGRRIVTQRLNELPTKAQDRIERWQQKIGGDLAALREILDRLDATDLVVAQFLVEVTSAIDRHRQQQNGPQLPLVGIVGKRRASGE